jgi:hypothetical protein
MSIISWLQSEVVMVQGLIQAGVAFGVAFGLHLTPTQIGAVLGLSAAVLSLITRQIVIANQNTAVAAAQTAIKK